MRVLISTALLLAFVGCKSMIREENPINQTSLPEIAGYTNWSRMTPPNYRVSRALSTLCVDPPAVMVGSDGPHAMVRVSVRVNALAEAVFSADPSHRVFPTGSIIVKVKYGGAFNANELGVMLKREPGYDPSGGDWEYAFVHLDSPTPVVRGPLKNCRSCHARLSSCDFVFAAYANRP